MIKKILFIVSGLLIFSVKLWAVIPSAPTITYPTASGAFHHQRPWIKFNTSVGGGDRVNRVEVQIDENGGDWVTLVYSRDSELDDAPDGITFQGWENSNGTPVGGGPLKHRVQSNLGTGTFQMRVRAWGRTANLINGTDRGPSSWSATRTFTISNPVWGVGGTVSAGDLIRDDHFTDLRTAINNIENFMADTPAGWTDDPITAGTTLIRDDHITEMRTAITTPYNEATGTSPSWTNDPLVAGTTMIRDDHINELRRACEGFQD